MDVFIVSLIPWLIYLIMRSLKALHMLQQNNYDKDIRFFKWIFKNIKKVFGGIELLVIIPIILSIFAKDNILIISFGIYYLLMFGILYDREKRVQTKKPLVYTSRIGRLCLTTFVLYIIFFIFVFVNFNKEYFGTYYLVIALLTYFNYFIILIANRINIPIEKSVVYYYRSKCKKKLKSLPNLKVIGITGSYGKTSSKNILNDILSIKYNVLPSPKNYNTPYGLIRTVNEYLDKFDDIFIAEMGAYKRGEIKELCNLVHPKYGILTKIGTAHLELFGSEENIKHTKFELIESLPSDGVGVLNGDDNKQLEYKLKNDCKIIWIGIDNKDVDVRALNIKMSYLGTTFDVVFKGDNKEYAFETKLLGYANIYNILAGIALGYNLGISISELERSVRRVKPVEHRLELKKGFGINIIDDAYNANPVGSKMALDVLKMMPGKRIIATPGMIELGSKQYEANREFGKHMKDICDEVILVGKEQTIPIYDGLKEVHYDPKHIHIINDVKLVYGLVNKLKEKETYLLLENDLPDIFNE